MRNCPNCGAPLDENLVKCPYCGTLYYDLTVLDDQTPCYVKFRTYMGTVTALAKPELKPIETRYDSMDVTDSMGRTLTRFTTSANADIGVEFHTLVRPDDGTLWRIET